MHNSTFIQLTMSKEIPAFRLYLWQLNSHSNNDHYKDFSFFSFFRSKIFCFLSEADILMEAGYLSDNFFFFFKYKKKKKREMKYLYVFFGLVQWKQKHKQIK